MRHLWNRAPWWRRLLSVANFLVVIDVIAWFIFRFPFGFWAIPCALVLACTFIILDRDKKRRQRDGSYWGPQD